MAEATGGIGAAAEGAWIADGEKYALVGLEVKIEGVPPLRQVAPDLWCLTNTILDMPPEWRKWLGSIRAKQVARSNLFLVSKRRSATADVMDDESLSLQRSAQHFYVGLLLSVPFSPSHRPFMVTGARRQGEIGIRHYADLAAPAPQGLHPYPPVAADDITSAAQIGASLGAMGADAAPQRGRLRLLRTLRIYTNARTATETLDRIHQYCRCIEGVILPAPGKTKRQFKNRTELFIGPHHHDLMGALYDIRSDVEHLHEDRYVEPFDQEVQRDLEEKESIIECIARTTLAKIIRRDALCAHFGNKTDLRSFWALSADKRREIWGAPIDPRSPMP